MSQRAQQIRVLIADDHPLYRSGVARVISQDPELELVGEAADGREALEAIRSQQPDVCVLDMAMPELDGLEVVQQLALDELDTKVIVVSGDVASRRVYDAIAAGASGYMGKTEGGQAIREAIHRVGRGEAVIPPELQAGIAEQIQAHAPRAGVELTSREREVLVLISKGSTIARIAEELFLSPATVKTHVQHLYEKLGVSDRAAAVMEASRRGLLE